MGCARGCALGVIAARMLQRSRTGWSPERRRRRNRRGCRIPSASVESIFANFVMLRAVALLLATARATGDIAFDVPTRRRGVGVRGLARGGCWLVALESSAVWIASGSAGRFGIVDVLGWQHDRQPGERCGAGALRRSPRRARHGRQRWCALALTPRGCSATPAAGSGYWCSAGSHEAGEVVSWSGRIPAARSIKGVEIAWVHAPKEVRRDRYPGDPLGARRFAYARESSGLQVRVLTSPDGSNFEEALCWKATGKDGESFTETLMFSRALAQGARRRGAGSAWRCTALRR